MTPHLLSSGRIALTMPHHSKPMWILNEDICISKCSNYKVRIESKICLHQYSHYFLVGLYRFVQALKVEILQEKQAMSDFPQVWFHFMQQALIGSLRIICMIRSSFIYFLNMAQDHE